MFRLAVGARIPGARVSIAPALALPNCRGRRRLQEREGSHCPPSDHESGHAARRIYLTRTPTGTQWEDR